MSVDAHGLPAVGGEAGGHVVGKGQAGRTVDRYLVVVVEHDELGQAEVAGKRGSFVADALHQVAIAAEDPGAVIDQIVAKAGVENPLA